MTTFYELGSEDALRKYALLNTIKSTIGNAVGGFARKQFPNAAAMYDKAKPVMNYVQKNKDELKGQFANAAIPVATSMVTNMIGGGGGGQPQMPDGQGA